MRRQKLNKKKSKRLFSKTSGTHRRNISSNPMRGGIRL